MTSAAATRAARGAKAALTAVPRPGAGTKTAALLALAFVLAGRHGVLARIGETEQEIRARYGPALKESGEVLEGQFYSLKGVGSEVHEKNGVYVCVKYLDGRCCYISFMRKAHGRQPPAHFTAEEATQLVAVNSGETEADWKIVDNMPLGEGLTLRVLQTGDGALSAREATDDDGRSFKSIVVYTAGWNLKVEQDNARDAEQKRKEKEASAKRTLDGF